MDAASGDGLRTGHGDHCFHIDTPVRVSQPIKRCGFIPGDHIGALYSSDEELHDLVRHYFVEGLTDPVCRQQCVYIYQQTSPEKFVSWFQESQDIFLGFDVDKFIRMGALTFIPATSTLGNDCWKGSEALLNFWMSIKNDALQLGYECVRVAVEMDWAIATGFPVNNLICWEAYSGNDPYCFGDRLMTIMCMYVSCFN